MPTPRLTFQAVVNASGNYTNLAQVSQANELDVDSRPGNLGNVPAEDDESAVTVTPIVPGVITVTSATICAGQSATLVATGCNGTVSWNTTQSGSSIVVSPSVTTSYTATCSVNGVTSLGVGTVTVNPVPTISVNSLTVTQGQGASLVATGCSGSVYWLTGDAGSNILVVCTATTSFTAVCVTSAGCSASAVATVTVLDQPPVANPDLKVITFNTPTSLTILANDRDKLGNPASLANVTVPVILTPFTNGTASINPLTGVLSYTPNSGFTGTDVATYQICNLGDPTRCASTTVTIIVDSKAPLALPDSQTTTLGQSTTICVLANDQDKTGAQATLGNVSSPVAGQPANGTVTAGLNGCLIYTPKPGFTGTDSFTYTICDLADPTKCATAQVTINVPGQPGPLLLLPKVYLQGALIGVYSPDPLMRDDLRAQGLLPTSSPYDSWSPITTTPTISTAVFAATGANAIVDWVFVELRSPASASTVVDSRAALLQRDGDIVEVDGVSPLSFSGVSAASYYIAVRHRNHLGVMTQTAIPLSASTTIVDFRLPSTPTFTYTGTTSYSQVTVDQAQVIVDQGVAMWAGNAFNDNEPVAPHDYVIYQGNNNDVNVIYQQVINPPGFLVTPFTIRRGYMNGDINMDGKTIFQGTQNDVEFIYQNVIKNHPGNQLVVPFFKIREQLP